MMTTMRVMLQDDDHNDITTIPVIFWHPTSEDTFAPAVSLDEKTVVVLKDHNSYRLVEEQ